MALTVAGVEGELRWSYHRAAVLGAWSIVRDPAGRVLTAIVVSQDTYRVSQRPLVFVAPHGTHAWTWPIETLQLSDGTLTARLGPQGVSHVDSDASAGHGTD